MGALSGLHAHRLQGCHVKNKVRTRAHSALFTVNLITSLCYMSPLECIKNTNA